MIGNYTLLHREHITNVEVEVKLWYPDEYIVM